MVCLCECMYLNYVMFCEYMQFVEVCIYCDIFDSVWELMMVKNVKVNFEYQFEKFEELILILDVFDLYVVYFVIDVCEGLVILLYGLLDCDDLVEFMIKVSQILV